MNPAVGRETAAAEGAALAATAGEPGAAMNAGTLPNVNAGRSAVIGTPNGPSRAGGTGGAVATAADTAAATGAGADDAGAALTVVCSAEPNVNEAAPPDAGIGSKLGAARLAGAAGMAIPEDVAPPGGTDADSKTGAARLLPGPTAAADTAALAGTLLGGRVGRAWLVAAGMAAANTAALTDVETDGRCAAARLVAAGQGLSGPLTGTAAATAAAGDALACTGADAGFAAAPFVEAEGTVRLICSGVTAATADLLPGAEAVAGGALLLVKKLGSAERLAWPNRKDVAPETVAGGAEAWDRRRLAAGAAEMVAGSDAAAWVALARTKPGSTGGPELARTGWPIVKARVADECCCASCACSLTAASACKVQPTVISLPSVSMVDE